MVTEIACIDRNYQAVLGFTVKICNWMDSKDYISEYGLFDFQRKVADSFVSPAAQLMDGNGNFTELGKMYVHQQPMKLPGKASIASIASIASAPAADAADVDADAGVADVATGTAVTNDEVENKETGNGEVEAEAAEFGIAAALGPDQQKALNAHNEKRKAKGLKPLAWDNQLAKNATEYAKHLAQIGKLQHSDGSQRPNQGENLAW